MREREQRGRGSQIKQTPLIPFGDAAPSSSSSSASVAAAKRSVCGIQISGEKCRLII